MQLRQRPSAIADNLRRTGRESGSISLKLILFALVLGGLAAMLVAQRRNHRIVAQAQVPSVSKASANDEAPADPEALAAAEKVAPTAQSPFEVVAQARAQNGPNRPPAPPSIYMRSAAEQWGFAVALLMGIVFATRKFAPRLGVLINRRAEAATELALADLPPIPFMEGNAPQLATAAQTASKAQLDGVGVIPINRESLTKEAAVKTFFEVAPDKADTIRSLFADLSRAPDEAARHRFLGALCEKVRSFAAIAETAEFAPMRQLALRLEGLIKQAAEKSSRLTPSVLRTGAAAIIQLEKFARKESKIEWPEGRNPRFLVVDDDPISRRAVSAALKKSFADPDTAENGAAALALAAEKSYDVIFLDVEMPGMDGFETCSKIHETEANRHTPVVFVTSHSDFESRTKSTEVGGHDLIGKPFLAFEVTVKALTLVIRAGGPRVSVDRKMPAAASQVSSSSAPKLSKSAQTGVTQTATPSTNAPNLEAKNLTVAPQVKEFTGSFLTEAPIHIQKIKEKARKVCEGITADERHENLGELYIDVHMLAEEAKRAGLEVILKVAEGLDNFIARLYEKPELAASTALKTADAAIDLMAELCAADPVPTLEQPFHRILVVDDDPIARRAICHALQLRFGQPECAESGDAAVMLASAKAYDVIFMDVRMPNLDGFAACANIRHGEGNREVPIVFVTSHGDAESQNQASAAGGSGFIVKPVLPSEIQLAALTHCVRGRLAGNKSESLPSPRAVASSEVAVAHA